MTTVNDRRGPFAPIGDALHDLHLAEEALRDEQHDAWARYVKEVDRILATDLRHEATEEVDDAAHALFEGVRGRLDELRVQAKLGSMEGEDLLTQVRRALTEMGKHLHR